VIWKSHTQKSCRAGPFRTVQETAAGVYEARQRCRRSSRYRQRRSTGPAAVSPVLDSTTLPPARNHNLHRL